MRSDISERVQKHRASLRASGLRPLQIWVPDVRRAGFADECRRQSASLKGDPQEADVLKWIDAASSVAVATDGWR